MMDAKWVRVLSDGTREPIKLPENFDVPRGEQVVVDGIRPAAINDTSEITGIFIKKSWRRRDSLSIQTAVSKNTYNDFCDSDSGRCYHGD